jgi:ABC-type Na+ efflux pump permease subunit
MKIFLVSLIVLALVVAAGGAWQIFNPPFTDAQISRSLVDTWEPHALVTTFVLALLLAAALFAGAVFAFGGARFKRISSAALLAIVAAAGLELASHILLSNQVARVTGQPLGALYGLL